MRFQNETFKTMSGLFFTYELKRGRDGEYTKELWVNRRENSKSLTWSSVLKAFEKTEGKPEVARPKDLGDIRGISYIYGIFYRFGLLEVPVPVRERMASEKFDFHLLKNMGKHGIISNNCVVGQRTSCADRKKT